MNITRRNPFASWTGMDWFFAVVLAVCAVALLLTACGPKIGGGTGDGGTFPDAGEAASAGGAERGASNVGGGDRGIGGDRGGVSEGVDSSGGAGAVGGGDPGAAGTDRETRPDVPDTGGGAGDGVGSDAPVPVVEGPTTTTVIGYVVVGVLGFALGAVFAIVLDFIADKRAAVTKRKAVSNATVPV